MPSFHCGVEVQAAIDAGLEVGFYRIQPDLTMDLQDLAAKLDAKPGPVLAIHYFGFGQPGIESLAELCRRAGVALIEDCAHALFSRHAGRELGEFAPLAIFSLRKTLPLLEGGALKVNAPFDAPPQGGFSVAPYRLYLKYAARACLGEGLAASYRRWRWGGDANEPTPPSLERDRYEDRLSALSRRLAAAADPSSVVDRRRRNWAALDARLAGAGKVFETLPDGVCPLFLPIWVAERGPVMRRLAALGVETFLFGAFSHPRMDSAAFPEAERLREEILCLPVHDQLTERSLDHMAAALGALDR